MTPNGSDGKDGKDAKAAAEAALDLLVYAPLGFALEARGLLPTFVERGKNQVTMARMIGQFAVQQGQTEATKRLGPMGEQVTAVLADLGLAPRPPRPADVPRAPRPEPRATVSAVPDLPVPGPSTSLAVDELAIPDYDSLAASQVVPRLRALSASELEDVRAYEAAGRARKTILSRIAQLQGG